MKNTGIWWDKSWSPVTGCSPVSEGCTNCWARRMSKRLAGRFGYPEDDPFRVTLHPPRLEDPYKWKKPYRVFVCSMGDLFHEDLPVVNLNRIFSVMDDNQQHTFLVLTKRPQQMDLFFHACRNVPPNVWLGVSVENQRIADERIPILLQIPAKVRFVSIEPMLGPVDLAGDDGGQHYFPFENEEGTITPGINWVILGGESGPRARPMRYDWAFDISDQCEDAQIPLFYKQGPDDDGNFVKMPKLTGQTWEQFPDG